MLIVSSFSYLRTFGLLHKASSHTHTTAHTQDTCCRKGDIAAKLAAVRSVNTPFKFYNANIATLKFSLEYGGRSALNFPFEI